MEIQQLSERSLFIYLDSKELNTNPNSIGSADARSILRDAMHKIGEHNWQGAYLELYPGHNSLLLVAQIHSGKAHTFKFKDLETAISASQFCRNGIISFLFDYNAEYYIIVYPRENTTPPALSEFGNETQEHPYFTNHITEHGLLILGPNALDDLKKVTLDL